MNGKDTAGKCAKETEILEIIAPYHWNTDGGNVLYSQFAQSSTK